jgi:yersiniabactin synthetase, thioesterase component
VIASGMLRTCLRANSSHALHLVICPFAGGASGAFRNWEALGATGANVSLAVYPGRDHRMSEPCALHVDELAEQLVEALHATGPEPRKTVLAGHSMGAQVAFEACARLEQLGAGPAGLVLSGCHAPHLQGRRRLSHLGDQDFLRQLVEIGGCNPELLANPALLALFLPMLRADFRATETYYRAPPSERQRLRTPALLIHGSNDEEAHHHEVAAWNTWLRDVDGPVAIAGNHFYVTQRPRAFINHIVRRFEPTSTHSDFG